MRLRNDSCRAIRNLLPLHVGGDLDPSQARRVSEHLHGCLPCFREYSTLAEMRGRLGLLAEQPLPAGALGGFTEEVMARIALGEPGPAADMPRRVARPRLVPRLAAAAALLAAVSLGIAYRDVLLPDPQPAAVERTSVADGTLEPQGWTLIPEGIDQPLATWPGQRGPATPVFAPEGGATRSRPGHPMLDEWLAHPPAGRLILRVPGVPVQQQLVPAGEGLMPDPDRQLRPRDPFLDG